MITEDVCTMAVSSLVLDTSLWCGPLQAVEAPGRSEGTTHPKSEAFVGVFGCLTNAMSSDLTLLISKIKCQH